MSTSTVVSISTARGTVTLGTTRTSQVTTSSSTPTGPVFAPGNGSFKLLGCYREQDGGRAFQDQVADDAMTVEHCLAAAAGRVFAGIAYGRECWFGNSLHSPLTKVGDDNCMFLCPGNPLQYCGSGNHMVLYSTGGEPLMPSHPATVGGAAFHGCMTKATGAQALDGASAIRSDMTLEKYGEFCGPATKYFGGEYGQECELDQTFPLILKGRLTFRQATAEIPLMQDLSRRPSPTVTCLVLVTVWSCIELVTGCQYTPESKIAEGESGRSR